MLFSKPIFTPAQIERFANIFDNAGQGIFVALVLTPLVQGFDNTNTGVLVLGAIGVIFCWTVSIVVTRREEILTNDI